MEAERSLGRARTVPLAADLVFGADCRPYCVAFCDVVLYLAALRGRICSAVFSNRGITNIGGMRYRIYLFHPLIIFVTRMTYRLHIGRNFWFYYFLQACMIVQVVLLLGGAFLC